MKTRTRHIHHLRKKKEVDYSNYHFAMALYTIYKKEGRKEPKLPVDDFRNQLFQKQSGTARMKQKLGRCIRAIRKAIISNGFIGKKTCLLITRLHNTSKKHAAVKIKTDVTLKAKSLIQKKKSLIYLSNFHLY